MAFDREAARAAGYTDEEIDAFLQSNPKATREETKQAVPVESVGEPPAPTTKVPEVGTSMASMATTGGLGAVATGAPALLAAGYGLGKYGPSIVRGAGNIIDKLAGGGPVAPNAPVGSPANPIGGSAPAARPVVPTGVAPATGPVAPAAQPMAAPAAQPAGQASLIDKTTSMIRQLAANKVFTTMAKGGIGAAAALTPGNIGQNYPFPTSGPYAGMEINPRTGRPWTAQELAQYR